MFNNKASFLLSKVSLNPWDLYNLQITAIIREILLYKFTVCNGRLCHIATVSVLIHFEGLYYLHIHGYAYLDKCCHKNGDSILLLNLDVNLSFQLNLSYQLQNPRTEPWFYMHCLQTEHNRNCTIVSSGIRVCW